MWTEANTLKLIDLYRERKQLWYVKHPHYYNKSVKYEAWGEIAAELETTRDECRRKMYGLQSSLRREKYKIRRSQKAGKGGDDVYRSCWFAFKSMSFLLNKKDTQGAAATKCQTSKRSLSGEVSSNSVPATNKRKNDVMADRTSTLNKNEEDGICQLFGNLVAKKMQMYSPLVQSAIQQAVMNVFFNADRGYYDQTSSSPMFDPSLSQNLQTSQNDPIQTNSSALHHEFESTLSNLKTDLVVSESSENDER